MNENEIEVSRVLISFEQLIEQHSELLERLENLLVFPNLDLDKANLLTKRLKKLRREIRKGVDILLENYGKIVQVTLREETYGICSYLKEIGIPEELEILERLMESAERNGYNLDLTNDIQEVKEFVGKLSQFNF